MHATAILFAATANPEESRRFYEEVMGLRFVSDHPYAIVFDINGIMLRVQKVAEVLDLPYTSLGFQVDDLQQSVVELQGKGVEFESFAFLEQDDNGIWTTPDGARVAWCRDPDGSMVSLTQHAE